MTKEELAALLNGMEYPLRIGKALVRQAEAEGLVIVYGASDDLMEFEGAIHDEIGAWNGVTVDVDANGLLPDFDELVADRDKDDLRDYFRREPHTKAIEAIWGDGGDYSWTYETEIPHVTFDVLEDGERYCRGIVFSMADLRSAS